MRNMPEKAKIREIMRELESLIVQLHSEGVSQDRINDIVLKAVKRRVERITPNPKPKPRSEGFEALGDVLKRIIPKQN